MALGTMCRNLCVRTSKPWTIMCLMKNFGFANCEQNQPAQIFSRYKKVMLPSNGCTTIYLQVLPFSHKCIVGNSDFNKLIRINNKYRCQIVFFKIFIKEFFNRVSYILRISTLRFKIYSLGAHWPQKIFHLLFCMWF